MELEVQRFIKSHLDWEKLLTEKPYCLDVSKAEFNGRKLVMLKYNIISGSDYNEEIVRECRGLILDAGDFSVVSFPFRKFGNVGEGPWVDEIDWQTAKTTSKIDGSLIKVVKLGGKLLISTNGTILAETAPVANQVLCPYKSYRDIAEAVISKKFGGIQAFMDLLEENVTYMFELVSPWTKVVVPFPEDDLYFLGCRDNRTFQETFFKDHMLAKFFKTPKVYPLKSLDQCVATAAKLHWDDEGYVVLDAAFRRIKVKSPAYLVAHRLKNNGCMSVNRALEIVKLNEISEVTSYFPEFKAGLLEVKAKLDRAVASAEDSWKAFKAAESGFLSRKEKAAWILENFSFPALGFALLDGRCSNARDFYMSLPIESLAKALGLKEK